MSDATDVVAALLAELEDAEVEAVSTAVLLRRTKAGLRLRRVDLAGDAQARMRELAAEFRDDLVMRAPIDYGYERRPEPHEIVVAAREEVAEAGEIVTALDQIEAYERLDLTDRSTSAARLFLTDARFDANGAQRRVVFVRTGVKSEIVTTKSKTALVFGEGMYDLVNSDQLVLDERYDAAILGDYVVGTNTMRFEHAFKFTDRILEAAGEVVDTHLAALRIVGFEDLAASCRSHPGMARKAASIGRKMDADPAYAAAMAMDPLLEFVDRHTPEVKVEVRDGASGRALVHAADDPSGQWAILKLLDDDYLTSELTESFYEAPSKSRP